MSTAINSLPVENLTITHGTGPSISGLATINAPSGVITTDTLMTNPEDVTDIQFNNSFISPTSVIMATIGSYSGGLGPTADGVPILYVQTPGSGVVILRIYNDNSSVNLNGTLKINFIIV